MVVIVGRADSLVKAAGGFDVGSIRAGFHGPGPGLEDLVVTV
jgi:hypothetical protein